MKEKQPLKPNQSIYRIQKVIRFLFDKISIQFGSDWNSFIFWKPMNWRNFTIFHLSFETNCYSRYFELSITILGLHLTFNIWRESPSKRKRKIDEFIKKIKESNKNIKCL